MKNLNRWIWGKRKKRKRKMSKELLIGLKQQQTEFGKLFPELQDLQFVEINLKENDLKHTTEPTTDVLIYPALSFKNVKENCQSNQRLKEVMEKVLDMPIKAGKGEPFLVRCAFNILLKELGLEK